MSMPMLQRLRLDNYRSFRSESVDLDNPTFLVDGTALERAISSMRLLSFPRQCRRRWAQFFGVVADSSA